MRTGLSWRQRILVRRRIKRAALTGYRNRNRIRYTQGGNRWWGINNRKRSYKGDYPRWGDCSAFATWCIWDGCLGYIRSGKIRTDFVNGAKWKAGFTGTMTGHGVRVSRPKLVGDLVFYGSPINHVAIYVGGGNVVSFGSDPGPLLLAWNYRDVAQTRRYVR